MNKKILVIDDERNWRDLFRIALKQYTIDIIEATSAEEGLAKAKIEKPDLILLDNKMPGMSGIEAAKILRNDSVSRNTPIIMVTSMKFSDDTIDYIKMDVHEFIKKPFETKELIQKMEKLLGHINHQSEILQLSGKKPKLMVLVKNKETISVLHNRVGDHVELIAPDKEIPLTESISRQKPNILLSNPELAGMQKNAIKLLETAAERQMPIILDLCDIKTNAHIEKLKNEGKRYFLLQPMHIDELKKKLNSLTGTIEIF